MREVKSITLRAAEGFSEVKVCPGSIEVATLRVPDRFTASLRSRAAKLGLVPDAFVSGYFEALRDERARRAGESGVEKPTTRDLEEGESVARRLGLHKDDAA